jgi:acetoin utilization protein AcuB
MQHDVVTLKLNDSLGLADDIMELARIRHLPVLSGSVVVGVVSQRDLYRAAVSSMLQMPRPTEREWLANIPVHGVMSANVFTIAPDAAVHTAVEMMLTHRIGCLPVVEHGKLVGLVSETDCLRYWHAFLVPEQKDCCRTLQYTGAASRRRRAVDPSARDARDPTMDFTVPERSPPV